MKPIFFFVAFIPFLMPVSGSITGQVSEEGRAEKIIVGSGPEDMVPDTLNDTKRLLISCASRRDAQADFGEIVSYDLVSGKIDTLVRTNEPDTLLFRPHGICLEKDILYIISHEREPDCHIVLLYKVDGDKLIFQELIRSTLLNSPNALVTGPSGEIYVVNDSGKRGSLAEKMFRLRRANVIRLSKGSKGDWKAEIVITGLGYPAGINRIGNAIFVGDAVLHKIHMYTISGGELVSAGEIDGLKGNDNIRIYKDMLLVPGHVKPLKFVGHARKGKISPVEVFLSNPETGTTESLFFDDGTRISGGSTAVIYNDNLYISQVFEPYILRICVDRIYKAGAKRSVH